MTILRALPSSLFLSSLVLATQLLIPTYAFAWREVAQKDGITIWTREVEGAEVRQVKAQAVVDASAERVWEVLRDVANFVEFMPYVEEAKEVGRESDDVIYVYQLIDPPLVDRRDYTLRMTHKTQQEAGGFLQSWTLANDKGPGPRKNAVRVTLCEGSWNVERLGSTSTRITYELLTHPGGSIPNWIANRANTSSIPDLLKAVRERSRNPKWKP